jgi:anti-anti-sigma regulatory factor
MSDPVRIEIRGHREHAVVTIVGALQGEAAHTLRRTLAQAAGMYSRVVVDVAGVTEIDPACLRELVAVQAALARKQGAARMVGLPRVLRHAFSSDRQPNAAGATWGFPMRIDLRGPDEQLAELHALEQVEERLLERFPLASQETVHHIVSDCHHEFDGRPIRDFVPVLVENDAAERLRLIDVRSPERLDDPWYDDDWPHVLS